MGATVSDEPAGDARPRTEDGAPESGGAGPPHGGRFALVLVTLVACWNLYAALVARTSREAIPPTLFVAGAIGLGAAAVGPERFKVAAFFLGAALSLLAIVSSV